MRWLERCVQGALCTDRPPPTVRVVSPRKRPFLPRPLPPPPPISYMSCSEWAEGTSIQQKWRQKRHMLTTDYSITPSPSLHPTPHFFPARWTWSNRDVGYSERSPGEVAAAGGGGGGSLSHLAVHRQTTPYRKGGSPGGRSFFHRITASTP